MSSRLAKINELIKISVAEIISREIEIPSGVLLTVTKVDVSRDLRYARIFVSVFPEKKFGKIMNFLQKKIYLIQGVLNRKISMKPLPRIEFIADKTEAKADKIEKLLRKL